MRRSDELGQRIARWQVERDIRNQDLASHLGVSRQRLWHWKTRGVPAGDVQLVTLAMRELQRVLLPVMSESF